MGLFDGIIKAFGGGSASGAGTVERNTRMVYIVDGDRINEGRGTPGPAERAGLIQRLAQFAQREQINIQVVLGGRPLREAAHGDEFNGIKVYYAEQGGGMAEQIGALYSKAGSSVLVITSDREVEQKIDSLGGAGNRMKGSTLRKALEGESGSGEDGRDRRRDRGGRGGDRGERRDRREPREPREPREDRNESRPATESDAGEVADASDADSAGSDDANDARDSRDGRRNAPSGQTSVKNLIDLVE